MSEPDFEALMKVNDELEKLATAKKLTRKEFDRLYDEAVDAVGDSSEFLESFLLAARMHGFSK